MERREYRNLVDKSEWPRGEWDNEPDKCRWADPVTGLPCFIRRNPMIGILCGYVGVAAGHPYYQKPYREFEMLDLDVHGGITFAGWDDEPGESNEIWWIGFDCGHAFDFTPGLYAYMARQARIFYRENQAYRNWAFVEHEVTLFAQQIKNLENV